MTIVDGDINTAIYTAKPGYDYALLHSPRTRVTHNGNRIVVEEPVRVELHQNNYNDIWSQRVEFEAAPGPAVFSLVRQGRISETIPLLIADTSRQKLGDAARQGQLAKGRAASELEEILWEVTRKIESAASTTRWVGSRLEVNGVRSPDLRGPKGAPGDVSMADFRPVRDAALNRPNGWIIPSESQLNATEKKARVGDLIHVVETRETWEVY